MTDEEILDFLGGPAFLAWFRMGNIQKWGGPLSADWRKVWGGEGSVNLTTSFFYSLLSF